MTHFDFQAPAELYLGSDWQTAAAQGPRTFRTAAQALRFALEEAAPVSLKGASLQVGTVSYTNDEMSWLYRSPDYPFSRKKTHQPAAPSGLSRPARQRWLKLRLRSIHKDARQTSGLLRARFLRMDGSAFRRHQSMMTPLPSRYSIILVQA